MKIAVTAMGREMSSNVDPRFGRAKYFIVVDVETNEAVAHDNTQNLNAVQGAGIQAAQNVAALGVQAVLSGNVGPKAYRALQAAGIKVCLCGPMTVTEALEKFRAGKLSEATSASVAGHWA